jgi:hypothetical protein
LLNKKFSESIKFIFVEFWMEAPQEKQDSESEGSESEDVQMPLHEGREIAYQPPPQNFPDSFPTPQPPPGVEDKGGLGGNAPPTLEPLDPKEEARCRRLRNQIKFLLKSNPKIRIDQVSKLDHDLLELNAEELKDILDNIKWQTTGLNPYMASQNILRVIGTGVESSEYCRAKGFQKVLANDLEAVMALQEFLPEFIVDKGPLLQLGFSAMAAYMAVKDDPINQAPTTHPNTAQGFAPHQPPSDGQDNTPMQATGMFICVIGIMVTRLAIFPVSKEIWVRFLDDAKLAYPYQYGYVGSFL